MKTAAQAFSEHGEDVARLLDIFQMEMGKLCERAEESPKSWEPVWTLALVRDSMIDIVQNLSGISRAMIEETLSK